MDRHNANTHDILYKPVGRDYVVVARNNGTRMNMSTNRVAFRCVSRILSYFTDEIEHILFEFKSITHVSLLKPNADFIVGTTVQIREFVGFTDSIFTHSSKIKDNIEASNKLEAIVSWKCLTTASDSSEPLSIMFEEVPAKVL